MNPFAFGSAAQLNLIVKVNASSSALVSVTFLYICFNQSLYILKINRYKNTFVRKMNLYLKVFLDYLDKVFIIF